MFGFIKRWLCGSPPVVAAEPSRIQDGRPLSDVEAMARIRNLLSDSRFKFRKLSTLAKAIGRGVDGADELLSIMGDVRESRNNHRRRIADRLYTFAS